MYLNIDSDAQTTTYRGLTEQQVREQINLGNVNNKTINGTKTVKEIFRTNIFTYFNLVFVILGILLVIARSYTDLSFLLVIVANSAIGIFQEWRSKVILDRMNLLVQQKVTVIRDGKKQIIPSDKLVSGDYAEIKSSMQVPADAVILEGVVHVSEAILTGESDEIEKGTGSRVFGGSTVISGNALIHIHEVGEETYASMLTKEATSMDDAEQSEILQILNKTLKFFGLLIIPLGIILFVEQYLHSNIGFSKSISGTVAALIGMIPEGIYLLASVTLAVSAARLATKKVLVHDLKCIETLARVDTLCVDKTGTLTEKEMKVVLCEFLDEGMSQEEISSLLADYVWNAVVVNETTQAVQEFFKCGQGRKAEKICPFSSKYKYGAQMMEGCNYVLGAPEFVLQGKIEQYREAIDNYAKKGCRVLAFAKYPYFPNGERLGENTSITDELIPVAILVIENPIRQGAISTFSYFQQQGVEIKIISGDNPLTVLRVAGTAGISNYEKWIDVSKLKTKEEIAKVANEYTVFGRVSPEQKKLLIAAMQDDGHKVAMTGDGVNDIIAMKQADCSIAMASGSDATAQSSQLVLLDSDFSRLPAIVDEGRRVVNNIQRAASLYLVKNIFSLFLAVFSVILMLDYPLNPSQITLISIFTIGIPSFILALGPNSEPIRGSIMKNVLIASLPAGITDFLVVSGLVLFCRQFAVPTGSMSTSCSAVVAIVGFMILYKIMKPIKKKIYLVMLFALIAGWLICMLRFSYLFGITSVSKESFMLLVIFAIISEPILRYLSRLAEAYKLHTDKKNIKMKK